MQPKHLYAIHWPIVQTRMVHMIAVVLKGTLAMAKSAPVRTSFNVFIIQFTDTYSKLLIFLNVTGKLLTRCVKN